MPYTKSKAGIGKGTTLSIGNNADPVVYTAVGEIKSLDQSGRQVATEDVTNMDSGAREFLPTLLDSGSWRVTGSRIGGDAGQVAMESAFAGLTVSPFQIQLPKTSVQATTGDMFAFDALIEDLNYSVAVDKSITFTATLKVSGLITTTPGS